MLAGTMEGFFKLIEQFRCAVQLLPFCVLGGVGEGSALTAAVGLAAGRRWIPAAQERGLRAAARAGAACRPQIPVQPPLAASKGGCRVPSVLPPLAALPALAAWASRLLQNIDAFACAGPRTSPPTAVWPAWLWYSIRCPLTRAAPGRSVRWRAGGGWLGSAQALCMRMIGGEGWSAGEVGREGWGVDGQTLRSWQHLCGPLALPRAERRLPASLWRYQAGPPGTLAELSSGASAAGAAALCRAPGAGSTRRCWIAATR